MRVPLLRAESRWECPNCDATDVTQESQPHARMHSCRGLRGMTVPFVPAGVRAKVVLRDREDYVGKEDVQRDGEGRPVMSAVVTRDDGEDAVMYAPCATAQLGDVG